MSVETVSMSVLLGVLAEKPSSQRFADGMEEEILKQFQEAQDFLVLLVSKRKQIILIFKIHPPFSINISHSINLSCNII